MEASLSATISQYLEAPAATLIDVLTVVVPAALGLLVIRLTVNWARLYFAQMSGGVVDNAFGHVDAYGEYYTRDEWDSLSEEDKRISDTYED